MTAAISVAALERRVPAERLPEVREMVLDAARRISDVLALAEG
ncbi:hypothetical protein ACFWPQ_30625 [Streptomyces sp. NPDC058464]